MCLCNILKKRLCLVPTVAEFAQAVFNVKNFWEAQCWFPNNLLTFKLNFEHHAADLSYYKDIPTNNLFEFGAYWCSFCSSSVLGQLLGNTISLADFQIVVLDLRTGHYRALFGTYQKYTFSNLVATGEVFAWHCSICTTFEKRQTTSNICQREDIKLLRSFVIVNLLVRKNIEIVFFSP